MVTLRPATLADAARLLEWRNDPATRAASLSEHVVSPEAHLAWLRDLLDDVNRRLFIAEADGLAVGSGRLDLYAGSVELNLTVAPEHRGHGHAPVIIGLLRRAALDAWGPLRHMAYVKANNPASLRAFLRAGFVGTTGALLVLEKPR